MTVNTGVQTIKKKLVTTVKFTGRIHHNII